MQWNKTELLEALASGKINFGSPLLEAGKWVMTPLSQSFDTIENEQTGLSNIYLLCRCVSEQATKAKKVRLDYDLAHIWLANPTKAVSLNVEQATFENSMTGESRSYNTYAITGNVELADKVPMTAAEKRKAAKMA